MVRLVGIGRSRGNRTPFAPMVGPVRDPSIRVDGDGGSNRGERGKRLHGRPGRERCEDRTMKFLIGYEVPSVRGTDEWKDRISRARKGTVDARKLQAFAEASRRWRERHPEAARQVMRTSRQRRRLRAMTIVGRGVIKCDRCGVDDPRILEINHLNGGGRAERRASEHDQNLYGPILRG